LLAPPIGGFATVHWKTISKCRSAHDLPYFLAAASFCLQAILVEVYLQHLSRETTQWSSEDVARRKRALLARWSISFHCEALLSQQGPTILVDPSSPYAGTALMDLMTEIYLESLFVKSRTEKNVRKAFMIRQDAKIAASYGQ
jgi:hypothetical protein